MYSSITDPTPSSSSPLSPCLLTTLESLSKRVSRTPITGLWTPFWYPLNALSATAQHTPAVNALTPMMANMTKRKYSGTGLRSSKFSGKSPDPANIYKKRWWGRKRRKSKSKNSNRRGRGIWVGGLVVIEWWSEKNKWVILLHCKCRCVGWINSIIDESCIQYQNNWNNFCW